MNLSAYDNVEENLNKRKTWVCPKRKILYSREIKFHKYYTLSKKFSTVTRNTDYYIIMLDKPDMFRKCYNTNIDDFGRIKLRINSIWESTSLRNIKEPININIEHIESDNDGDIYYVDV